MSCRAPISSSAPGGPLSKTTTPTAPALVACSTLSTNQQPPPRSATTMLPLSPSTGNGSQACGFRNRSASTAGAVSDAAKPGPEPVNAAKEDPPNCTLCSKRLELAVAATAITSGATAGEEIVLRVGDDWPPTWPELPAAATTTRPKSTTALWAATASGSQLFPGKLPQSDPYEFQGWVATWPMLRLRMSIPSTTASSMAAIRACELAVGLIPGVPVTLYTPRYARGAIPSRAPAGDSTRLPAATMATAVP